MLLGLALTLAGMLGVVPVEFFACAFTCAPS